MSRKNEESTTTDQTTEMVPGLEAGKMLNDLYFILKTVGIQGNILNWYKLCNSFCEIM